MWPPQRLNEISRIVSEFDKWNDVAMEELAKLKKKRRKP
jgi:hypothetical protein